MATAGFSSQKKQRSEKREEIPEASKSLEGRNAGEENDNFKVPGTDWNVTQKEQ